MDITVDLAPGETLRIDSEKGIIEKEGVEIHDISGGFFNLDPGTNTLHYEDSETGRTLEFRIEFQEEYV